MGIFYRCLGTNGRNYGLITITLGTNGRNYGLIAIALAQMVEIMV